MKKCKLISCGNISNCQKSTKSKDFISKLQKNKTKIYELDSLNVLKESSEKQSSYDINSKIKLLKSELKLLISETKKKNSYDSPTDENINFSDSSLLSNSSKLKNINCKEPLDNIYKKPFELLNDDEIVPIIKTESFKPSCSSTPSKFSVWLNKTIEDTSSKTDNGGLVFETTALQLNSKSQVDLTETSLYNHETVNDFLCKYSLPQDKVEELLYKSFLIKRSKKNSFGFENSNLKDQESTHKLKHFKNSNSKRKCNKTNKQGFFSNQSCTKSYTERKSRLIPTNYTDGDDSKVNETSSSSVICMDLDVSKFDWDEPFNVEENFESQSVIEIEKSHNLNDFPEHNPLLKHKDSETLKNSSAEGKKLWECPVCFEQSKGQEIVATQCGHVFCKKCLENHFLKLSKTCPSCRCDLRKKTIITLFNF